MNFTLTSASITGVSRPIRGIKFTLKGAIDTPQLEVIGFGQGLGPYKSIKLDYSAMAEQHLECVMIDDDGDEAVYNEGDVVIQSCELTRNDRGHYIAAFKVTATSENQRDFVFSLLEDELNFHKVDVDGGVVELPMKHDHELPGSELGSELMNLTRESIKRKMEKHGMMPDADERETVLTGKGGGK